jgi:DJ-1 family protein
MRFACLLADGFEDMEALGTTALLRRAGIKVDFVSVDGKTIVRGAFDTAVKTDIMMSDLDSKNYDGLFIPGGRAAFLIRENQAVLQIVIDFNKQGKYLMAICAGPTVLAAAGVMRGKKYISFPGTEPDMQGAIRIERMAVSDGKITTAIGAGAIYEFALEIVRNTLGQQKADELAKRILYRQFE